MGEVGQKGSGVRMRSENFQNVHIIADNVITSHPLLSTIYQSGSLVTPEGFFQEAGEQFGFDRLRKAPQQ